MKSNQSILNYVYKVKTTTYNCTVLRGNIWIIDLRICNAESRAITKYTMLEYADKGTELVSKDSKKMVVATVPLEVEAHQIIWLG